MYLRSNHKCKEGYQLNLSFKYHRQSPRKKVHKYVFNFFRDNEVITTVQLGFILGDSTLNQLVDVYNIFCKAIDEGKELRAIFCDISKAFDSVWHRGLLFKLQSVGISGLLLQWFTGYSHSRKH